MENLAGNFWRKYAKILDILESDQIYQKPMKFENFFSSKYVINMLDTFNNNFDHRSIIQIPKN